MGRTACTEPQCLYKGDLYLNFLYSEDILIAYRTYVKPTTLNEVTHIHIGFIPNYCTVYTRYMLLQHVSTNICDHMSRNMLSSTYML